MKNRYRTCFPVFCAVIIVSFLTTATSVNAEDNNSVPLFYELMPGCTHFYEGDIIEGAAFLGTELLLGAWAIGVNSKLKHNDAHEWNVPLILAGQLYTIDKWRYYQKNLMNPRKSNIYTGKKYDPSPLRQLLKAPFDPQYISSPVVIAFALLGIVDGIIAYPRCDKRYKDISRVNALGYRLNRKDGTFYYESASTALSYGAAVSEEMLFRGILLPTLDYHYGKKTGLISSSLVFGLLHLTNRDIDRSFYFVSQATLAGFALGKIVQNNDYRLGKAIAAHFWYNIVSLTTTWLINPRENPLGLSVEFKF